jgi:hypothetical protein
LIASDGSFKNNVASLAVTSETHSFVSTLPGAQTIQRADLFGILSALWVTDPSVSTTIVTDSYSSKSIIEYLWSQRNMACQYSSPANKSILMSILDLLQERDLAGALTHIMWVCSHTGDASSSELQLNDKADMLAVEARRQLAPCQLSECKKHIDNFFFADKSCALIQSDMSSKLKKHFLDDELQTLADKAIKKKADHALSFFAPSSPGILTSFLNIVNVRKGNPIL